MVRNAFEEERPALTKEVVERLLCELGIEQIEVVSLRYMIAAYKGLRITVTDEVTGMWTFRIYRFPASPYPALSICTRDPETIRNTIPSWMQFADTDKPNPDKETDLKESYAHLRPPGSYTPPPAAPPAPPPPPKVVWAEPKPRK